MHHLHDTNTNRHCIESRLYLVCYWSLSKMLEVAEEWSSMDTTFRSALSLTLLTSLLQTFAFVSPLWLVSIPDEALPEPKFVKLGLWEVCLNGYRDMRQQYETRFYGCRNIFVEEYDIIRGEIQPPFFVATEVFFTLGFLATLVALTLSLSLLLCIHDYYRLPTMRYAGSSLLVSGLLTSLALIIFALYGDGRYFMPEWEHNHVSWSFAAAFVGALGQFASSVLFFVEARVEERREQSYNKPLREEELEERAV